MKINLLLVVHVIDKDGKIWTVPSELTTENGKMHDDISDVMDKFDEDFHDMDIVNIVLHQVVVLPS